MGNSNNFVRRAQFSGRILFGLGGVDLTKKGI